MYYIQYNREDDRPYRYLSANAKGVCLSATVHGAIRFSSRKRAEGAAEYYFDKFKCIQGYIIQED